MGISVASRQQADANDVAGQPEADDNDVAGPPEADADDVAGPCSDGFVLDFRHSLYIPGLLHITHNIAKDLPAILVHWEIFVEQLRHVCRLLTSKWSKQRLLQTHFIGAELADVCKKISSFGCKVYEGRWGEVLKCIEVIAPLHDVLQSHWNISSFLAGGGVSERNDREQKGVQFMVQLRWPPVVHTLQGISAPWRSRPRFSVVDKLVVDATLFPLPC